jgi:TusA-related sulfurtransferase
MMEFSEKIDLRGIPCPRNTAKALMFLETVEDGSVSLVFIDNGEPLNNFLESLELEGGYSIKEKIPQSTYWEIYILKEG